jgi:hypothetical protein
VKGAVQWWYWRHRRKLRGPISTEERIELIRNRRVGDRDEVRRVGSEKWLSGEAVKKWIAGAHARQSGKSTTDEPITRKRFDALWVELAREDGPAAYRATWALSVPSAVPMLDGRLRAAGSSDPQGIPAAEGPIAPAPVLRTLRAITALERVGTPGARAVLERLTRGNDGAIETRESKLALERLNCRNTAR